MRKSIIIFIFILLLSSCSTTSKLNINNELPGYEYLITNREGYNTTYSFYGNKANTIIKDEVKEQIKDEVISIKSYDEFNEISNGFDLKSIFGENVFDNNNIGISQRSDNYDSLYSLNVVYNVHVSVRDDYIGTGWANPDDMVKRIIRNYQYIPDEPKIENDYVLDIFLYNKNHQSNLDQYYSFVKLYDEYDSKFFTTKDNVKYIYNKFTDTYSIYKTLDTDYSIRNKVNNKSVTRIYPYAFEYSSKLQEILIPSSINQIGRNSFHGCTNLKDVTFESNSELKRMGKSAFYSCFSIEEINLPDALEYIGEGAFNYCMKLNKVNISEKSSLKIIDKGGFHKCFALEEMTLPNLIEKIDNKAFYDSGLIKLNLSNCVAYIGNDVFGLSEGSKTITISCKEELDSTNWSPTWNNGVNINLI